MLTKMIEKVIDKRKETRKVFLKNAFDNECDYTNMSEEEFKFMKAVLELERMTDDLLGSVGAEIEKLKNEVDRLNKSNKELLERAK